MLYQSEHKTLAKEIWLTELWKSEHQLFLHFLYRQYYKFTTQGRSPKQVLKSHKVTSSEMRLCHPWPLDFQYKDDSQRLRHVSTTDTVYPVAPLRAYCFNQLMSSRAGSFKSPPPPSAAPIL